jgi:hypothetical protein
MLSAVVAAVVMGQVKMPRMYSREDWGAKPVVLELTPHKIDRITVHHTGVKQDKTRSFFGKLQGLQAWSQREDELEGGKPKPQWADIPYHYYIDWNGDIAECRPIGIPGDTNTSYDVRGHALVVVEGTLSDELFNDDQREALMKTVLWLADKYQVPADRIKGHMDYAPGETDCPGKAVMDFLPEIRRKVRDLHRDWGTN